MKKLPKIEVIRLREKLKKTISQQESQPKQSEKQSETVISRSVDKNNLFVFADYLMQINDRIIVSLDTLYKLKNIFVEGNIFFSDIIQEIFEGNELILSELEHNIVETQDAIFSLNSLLLSQNNYVCLQEKRLSSVCDLNCILKKVSQSFILRENKKSKDKLLINYNFDCGSRSKQLEIFTGELEKAIDHIFDNAYHALKIKANNSDCEYLPTILIETQNLTDSVRIIISDNGEGIHSSNIAKVFEPFWTTKPNSELGLGLYFVRQIIEILHKGKIEVKSVLGQYSRLTISLPKNYS